MVAERAGPFFALKPQALSFAALPRMVMIPTRQSRPIMPFAGQLNA